MARKNYHDSLNFTTFFPEGNLREFSLILEWNVYNLLSQSALQDLQIYSLQKADFFRKTRTNLA